MKTRLEFYSQQSNLSSTALTSFYISVGEKDKAFAELNKTYENRESGLANLKVDPYFDNLRDDPRFADLMRRVDLPQ